ncbi:hypothetical protein DL93DRAFT_842355 [Clavulina sp. PMI_390]|nr:hypothetical protein DL93DRAFT_842355 [Clavulina sp. PMI_390]
MVSLLALTAFATLLGLRGANADITVYTDTALASGWEDWSWGSTINYAATDVYEGTSSISIATGAWSAFSPKLEGNFSSYAGFRFDILGAQPDVSLYFTDSGASVNSASIALATMSSTVNTSAWTTITVDFSNMPGTGTPLGNGTWDRITFQGGANGATFHLDNVVVLSELIVTPLFLSAEPLAQNLLAVTTQGAVDLTKVTAKLSGKALTISSHTSYVPVNSPSKSITYYTLSSILAPGNLTISTPTGNFSFVLPAPEYGSITTANTVNISSLIYGINFPANAATIQDLGITISRWGGNAVTAYNPFGGFTNAGNDWYFENRVIDNGQADDWNGWVQAAGSKVMMTIPALDWVAKDSTSYSYSASKYPSQLSFDPYKPDAGDGQYPNGSWVSPVPPQTTSYTPWNTSMAATWLKGMVHKPEIVTIDNEIEIASSTHQDMHPSPMGYDEELARVVNTSLIAKASLPNALVAAPSTCAWWFYWTSSIGYTDNAAHNNMDFLPWFLQQMKAAETKYGKRLLDYLDIHYYFAADTSANDAAAKALRLRMTRSLWDPSYTDESYIGTTTSPQWNEPNPNQVWLIPRMKQLIAQYYPGTKLSIGEWNSQADTDITGGLVTADSLGIFGRYGVDSATYWDAPDENGPIGLAYWLYRGYGTYFGSKSVQVNLSEVNESVLGYYAGLQGSKVSIVIVNKDVVPIGLTISNIPSGKYFMRHFGGGAGVAKWQTNITFSDNTYFVVPAYTAVFFLQQ